MWGRPCVSAARAVGAPRWAGVRLLSTCGVGPPFRVLLMGADAFSCATLQALHDAPKGEVQVMEGRARWIRLIG